MLVLLSWNGGIGLGGACLSVGLEGHADMLWLRSQFPMIVTGKSPFVAGLLMQIGLLGGSCRRYYVVPPYHPS